MRVESPNHINIEEGAAVIRYLRWVLRSKQRFRHRVVLLVDRKVALCAIAKGRSSSKPLNTLVRRAAALCFASQVAWFCIVSSFLRSIILLTGHPEATALLGPRPCGSASTRRIDLQFAQVVVCLRKITRCISPNALEGNRVRSTTVVSALVVALLLIMIRVNGVIFRLGTRNIRIIYISSSITTRILDDLLLTDRA